MGAIHRKYAEFRRMTRRTAALLALLPTSAAQATPIVTPTDMTDLNRFATAYNKYVEELGNGLMDLRLWRHVKECWERMTKI